MSNRHAFTRMDGEILFEKAALRMDALLAEYGASHSSKPPPAVELEMFRRAMVETAAVHFPGVDLEAVGYGFHACAHPAFLPAFERVRLSTADNSDVFAVARGVDAAIVLAGFGLPVAPYDLMTSRIIEKPSNDMNAVLTLFRRDQTAFVSYNVCAAPFYVLLTDCVRSLRQRVANDPRLSEVERLFARTGGSLLSDPEKKFMSKIVLFSRRPGDAIFDCRAAPSEAGGRLDHAARRVAGRRRTPWCSE